MSENVDCMRLEYRDMIRKCFGGIPYTSMQTKGSQTWCSVKRARLWFATFLAPGGEILPVMRR
eukprot:4885964-Pyramimonas_sp.AAC.1